MPAQVIAFPGRPTPADAALALLGAPLILAFPRREPVVVPGPECRALRLLSAVLATCKAVSLIPDAALAEAAHRAALEAARDLPAALDGLDGRDAAEPLKIALEYADAAWHAAHEHVVATGWKDAEPQDRLEALARVQETLDGLIVRLTGEAVWP